VDQDTKEGQEYFKRFQRLTFTKFYEQRLIWLDWLVRASQADSYQAIKVEKVSSVDVEDIYLPENPADVIFAMSMPLPAEWASDKWKSVQEE
jgi:hypothetical protein